MAKDVYVIYTHEKHELTADNITTSSYIEYTFQSKPLYSHNLNYGFIPIYLSVKALPEIAVHNPALAGYEDRWIGQDKYML